jgi:DNA polymerase III sliding clamp (beta) subunit (PCNA family)
VTTAELDTSSDIEDIAGAEPDDGEEAETFVPSTANLKVSLKKFVLQSLLDKASSVLPSRDIMPVLKNFQVEVTDDLIRVVSTDLELSVIAESMLVATETPGSAVFPGKKLIDIVKEADDGDLVIDVIDGTANIAVGRASWQLRLMDGTDYPDIPRTEEVEFHDVDRGKFLGALNAVRYAAAKDTVRANLMMISIRDGKMRAADGARFQQVDVPYFPMDMDIPIGAIPDLTKLLRQGDADIVGIGQTIDHLVFQVGTDVFIANKLVQDFPDLERILLRPALGNTERLQVDRSDLLAAIRRVRVTADENTSAIVLDLATNRLILRSRDRFGNTAEEEVNASWTERDREVAVNHTFLTEMLEGTDVKSCQIFFGPDSKSRKSPILLKDDSGDVQSVGVLQQMRMDHIG